MSDDISPEERAALISEFLSESSGFLQDLNQKLVSAEESVNCGKALSDDDLHEMFRAAHNIKGMAAFVGLPITQTLTHEMETVLSKVRNKELQFNSRVIDVLFEVFDALEEEFQSLKDTSRETTDVEQVLADIKGLLEPAPDEKKASPPEPAEQPLPPADKYIAKFIEDTDHQIVNFNNVLLSVESNLETPGAVNELFRIIHTVKGSAGLVNAKKIAKIAHSMENILAYYRDAKTKMDETTISLLFVGIDAVKEIISLYKEKSATKFDTRPICAMFDVVYLELTHQAPPQINGEDHDTKEKQPVPAVPRESQKTGIPDKPQQKPEETQMNYENIDLFRINVAIMKMAAMKSVKLILALEKLAPLGKVIACKPGPEQIKDDSGEAVEIEITFASSQLDEKDIRKLLKLDAFEVVSIERVDTREKESSTNAAQGSDGNMLENNNNANENGLDAKTQTVAKPGGIELSTIRIDSNKLDTLMNLAGELVIVRARFAQLVGLFNREISVHRESVQTLREIKSSSETLSKEVLSDSKTDSRESKRIRSAIEELDAKIEQIMTQSSKNSFANTVHALDEITGSLGKISSDIQTGVMQARMIPIEGIFTRFKRIIRDIAKSLNKDVCLQIKGETTELDKKLVDSLGDPLTHMVRNAIDHGIEDAETRRKTGKPPTGTISLSAEHKGNNIWIEVRDDGRGIDVNKVTESAVRKGLYTETNIEKMTEKDKLNILFLPGFSTAEKVTSLSGRGVGMDVVKNMITSVNGTIDIETQLGKGTTFILKIPLTLAIIEALLVVIGDSVYAFPLEAVTEIVKISSGDIYSVNNNDTIKLREHALSLVELPDVLKINAKKTESPYKRVVVITDGNKKVGVVVDDLVGEDEIVIKSLPEYFAHVRGITGASILGDGRIALILDPADIISKANKI
ncbi:MAG: Hpt domain-containing protein [Elusimicrobiaceae bacterium]